jgi:uncharacterized protein (DUF342 family)
MTDEQGEASAVSPETSAIGNVVDLGEGQVLLPAWVGRRADGLYADAGAAAREGGFQPFVERAFDAGARFAGLDYDVFRELLHDPDALEGASVRFAADIVPFPSGRRALYRPVKIAPDRSSVDYLFEPVEIEVAETVLTESGQEEVRTRGEPTRLDFDEFVAAMWEKGVRYGIDAPAVRAAIASGQPQRLTIARALPPTPGRDATVEEKTDALHRDNAPRILPDGRMDLRQFKNRFPQIGGGARLLKKIPRVAGRSGRDVTGRPLEPDMPKDFDFTALAGPGTKVVKGTDGEYIVAAMDGFINIDNKTNQISVTEKIVSHEGVSMKTTGDVTLTGDEFEEHGEVQDRRVVEGKHMTFFADVYGGVVSRGGRVVFKASIAGGSASSPGGSIVVEGRASRATLEARGGEVRVEFAEGCSIVANRVVVNHAVNCDILGEEVEVGASEGSAIAGKHVKIAQSGTRKDTETIVAVLVPDMTRHERDVGALEEGCLRQEERIAALDAKIGQMQEEQGFRQFLALAVTIAKGGAKLSAAHEANWHQAQARYAASMREWQAVQKERAAAAQELDALRAELESLADRKSHAGDGIGCSIEAIAGDTLVRRLAFQPDQAITGGVQAGELAAHLREFGVSGDRLFWGASGAFAWRHDTGECAVGQEV